MSQNKFSKVVTCVCDLVGEITNNISFSCKCSGTCMENNNPLEVQSSDVSDTTEITSEVVTFVDNSRGDVEDLGYTPSPLISAGSTMNTDLQKFLSRPTKIDSTSWSTSDLIGIQTELAPWYLFLNNATIKNKIQNYAFLRAKLHVKFILNATPFHFGLYRVAYEPSVNAANTGFRKSKIRSGVTGSNGRLLPFSQLPGVYISPADNSGGEMIIPFFLHSDWLNLNSASDVTNMGLLTFYLVEPLQVASAGGSTTVTIDTFAWLEDVEFNGSTSQLVLQAQDEYDGIISKPASAMANIANKLTNVPVIGKFARATEIGASAIAGIASIFGFTNVPVIADVSAVVTAACPHLASSQISTPVQKLTLDPKQELSVDPSMHGVPSEDQMAIANIVKIKSALTVVPWATSQAADVVLFNARINPALCIVDEIVNATDVVKAYRTYHTPLSYLDMAFDCWRGDICLEFTVICTKFHKGRIKISWDPLGAVGTAAIDDNQVYTTIIDIGETNNAIIRVPYHQAYAFLRTRNTQENHWSLGAANAVNTKYDNGLLIMSILTPLISPVSPQTIGILVSVYGAENFEFANPRQCLGQDETKSPPSFFAVQAKDEIDITPSIVTLGDKGSQHPERYKQNMGQGIFSLRTLLHRYSRYDTSMVELSSATRCILFNKSFVRFPPMFGYDPNGLSLANDLLTATTSQFNFTPTHPITYFGMLYAGFSGGVNYVTNVSKDLIPSLGQISVQRYNTSTAASSRRGINTSNTDFAASTTNSIRWYNLTNLSHGTAGEALTNTMTNGSLNWYQPMMLQTNLNYPDATTSMTGNTYDGTDRECSYMSALVHQYSASSSASNNTAFINYAGTAPDFNLFWFLCCPTIDYYVSVPVQTT